MFSHCLELFIEKKRFRQNSTKKKILWELYRQRCYTGPSVVSDIYNPTMDVNNEQSRNFLVLILTEEAKPN